MFVDSAQIKTKAGKGGDGIVSWRRERWVPKGGPDGGDGGKGGDVVFVADHNLNTLSSFRSKQLVTAEDGKSGRHRRQHGKGGKDAVVKVPVGTVVRTDSTVLADFTKDGQIAVVAKGGRGGYGNAHFKSSVRQAPEMAEIGEPGEEKAISLELKILADVGLIGLPNAGKSTLLSVVSNAKPEIADYPFTTLAPNLGVVDIEDSSFLMADIPGLIEGASSGKGLGDEFLRHIERTAILLHIIDASVGDAQKAWQTINQELKNYKVNLSSRPQIVVLNKIDAISDKQKAKLVKELEEVSKTDVFPISAVAKDGIMPLLHKTALMLKKHQEKAKKPAQTRTKIPTLTLADDPNAWWIEKKRRAFVVKGAKIEGFAKRTNYQNQAAMGRLRNIMSRLGINRELIRLGIKNGERVRIAGKSFRW